MVNPVIIFKVALGIITILIYKMLCVYLSIDNNHKTFYFVTGILMFSVIFSVAWAINIISYNSIIYWRIVELFK